MLYYLYKSTENKVFGEGITMNIAICDDDSVFRNFLEKNLRTYFDERSVPLNIIQFSSGEALLGHDLLFDLVFLDVEMGEINGIDTGKALKKKNPHCITIVIMLFRFTHFGSFRSLWIFCGFTKLWTTPQSF